MLCISGTASGGLGRGAGSSTHLPLAVTSRKSCRTASRLWWWSDTQLRARHRRCSCGTGQRWARRLREGPPPAGHSKLSNPPLARSREDATHLARPLSDALQQPQQKLLEVGLGQQAEPHVQAGATQKLDEAQEAGVGVDSRAGPDTQSQELEGGSPGRVAGGSGTGTGTTGSPVARRGRSRGNEA